MTTPLPLEPIEKASRDELAALQLERLKWSLKHAYENSPVYRHKFDGLGAHYGAERSSLTVIPFGGGQTEKQVQLIQDFRPDIIMVTPSYMLSIADEFERQGVEPAQCSLRIGIFGAEPWANDMRRAIETRMGIDAVDIYGLSEVMGPGVASECAETKDGPTIWEDHFYSEIIDPEIGEVLPDGEFGELVFTSLTKEALPIIRYRTRDLTHLLPGTARTMRRMEKITGRSDDMMIVRGVNVFPTQIEELLLKRAVLAPHYQIVLTKEGPLDVLTLNVEPCPESSPDAAALDSAKAALAYDIKALIGGAIVNVLAVNGIERSVGKARRVIDRRNVKP
ncbi:Phenylacetate-coenzyme A ligase PaaF [Candidatus Paraburkholderia kirkii UZHbot1]|uniref:Phenylacetate-coenzyme A ligase PaaF n=1 Tax=Candidatus Paraburkholderia kirkii UZHbot1 TaxID=1055526 RepID=G4MAY3_9BURK|nr:Phenylacetate-coenzyme A ligase PaaF [Candidatus Paraburkholderia kirkii UZHbot1]